MLQSNKGVRCAASVVWLGAASLFGWSFQGCGSSSTSTFGPGGDTTTGGSTGSAGSLILNTTGTCTGTGRWNRWRGGHRGAASLRQPRVPADHLYAGRLQRKGMYRWCENVGARHRRPTAGKSPSTTSSFTSPSAVPPITAGASCDRCDAHLISPVASAITDTHGNFVLDDVPVGADIPVVIQVGKWRR